MGLEKLEIKKNSIPFLLEDGKALAAKEDKLRNALRGGGEAELVVGESYTVVIEDGEYMIRLDGKKIFSGGNLMRFLVSLYP